MQASARNPADWMRSAGTYLLGAIGVSMAGAFATFAGVSGVAGVAAIVLVVGLTLRYGVGVPILGLILAGTGAVPFINASGFAVQGVEYRDIAVAGLIALLLLVNSIDRFANVRAVVSPLTLAGAGAFLMLWVIVCVRTIEAGTPILQTLRMSRDLIFIPMLTPLLAGALVPSERRRMVLYGMFLLATLLALGIVGASLGIGGLVGTLVISDHELQQGGLVRLYPLAGDLLVASTVLSLGWLLIGQAKGRDFRLAAAMLGAGLFAILLLQTRAFYLAIPVGVAAALVLGRARIRAVSRFAAAGIGALVLAVTIGLAQPDPVIRNAVSAVGDRFVSATADVESGDTATSTLAYRQALARKMTERLDRERAWTFGLGFLSPTSNYDLALPGGSIRNPDVGFLNVVMTMGIVGTIAYYGMLLGFVAPLVRSARSRDPARWLAVGALGFALVALVGSPTLVTFFGPSGCVATSVILALGVASSAQLSRPARADRSPRGRHRVRRHQRPAPQIAAR